MHTHMKVYRSTFTAKHEEATGADTHQNVSVQKLDSLMHCLIQTPIVCLVLMNVRGLLQSSLYAPRLSYSAECSCIENASNHHTSNRFLRQGKKIAHLDLFPFGNTRVLLGISGFILLLFLQHS